MVDCERNGGEVDEGGQIDEKRQRTHQVMAYVACWLRNSMVGGLPTGIPCCMSNVAGDPPPMNTHHTISIVGVNGRIVMTTG